jgi:integrase
MSAVSSSFKFNNKLIGALPPNPPDAKATEKEYSDLEVTGLKVLVSKKGRKHYYLRYTFAGRKRAIKLGEHGAIDVAEARKKAYAMRALIDNGTDPLAVRDALDAQPTFRAFCEKDYMPYALQHKRSADDDESKLRTRVYDWFGAMRLAEIGSKDVQRYLDSLLSKDKLKPGTVNRHLSLLSAIFRLAVQYELVPKNPCSGIPALREYNKRDFYLSESQLGKLFQAMDADGPEDREQNRMAVAAIKLLVLTGTRREETMHARWEHVDLDNRLWFIPMTKNGTSRTVPLNDAACDLIRSIDKYPDCPYLFVNVRTGQRLNTPVKTFKRLLARAGIEACRIHDLRHTFASLAVNSGTDIYVVQKLLGHSSAQTTQRYAHLDRRVLHGATNVVGDIVNRAAGKD